MTTPGVGARVVGVGRISSGLADPPHPPPPFLSDLDLTNELSVEVHRIGLPHELSPSRASPWVCAWVRVAAVPPGPFAARARVAVGVFR